MNADDRRAYERDPRDVLDQVRDEILDLCDSIDGQFIDYDAIATKLRAIVAEDS